ncbi:MAG: PHB depolymerase family esterase [Bacteroidota bacterium]
MSILIPICLFFQCLLPLFADESLAVADEATMLEFPPQEEYTFASGGIDRTYILYKPVNLPEGAPLVFVLHGFGGSAKGMMGYANMNTVADQHGFMICYPQGNRGSDNKNSWNAGYSNPEIDDVQFLSALARYLQETHALSKKSLFCTGMSNGADMSYVLACQKPDLFTAVAPVAGCMMQTTFDDCANASPIPIFEIHGTRDQITLWKGDSNYSEEYGGYLGTEEIIEFWKKVNQCTQVETDTLPDLDPNDGSVIVSEKHSSANRAEQVWLFTLVDGKHDWPGSWGNKDVQTGEVVWAFFSQFLQEE